MKLSLTPSQKLRLAATYLRTRAHRNPLIVSLEVTRRCNARCDFCNYWKTDDRDELTDFADVVRRFDPLSVVFTGGEPMLRRDLPAIIRSITQLPGFRFQVLLTHGGFLTEEKVREVVDAGIHQINVSLDYPDRRQDVERGIPGLFDRLSEVIPKLTREGVGVFSLSCMLMSDNMRDAEALVRLAATWGVHVTFSAYNDLKTGGQDHFPRGAELEELRAICARLKRLKRELGNVFSSDFFLDTLPVFYERREIPGCQAGRSFLHVSPRGTVHPCAELPSIGHYTSFVPRQYPGSGCGRCFDACRSEPQAPLDLRRLGELAGIF